MTLTEAKRAIRKQGPCAMCGYVPWAAHRVIDAQMGRVAAGEPIEQVAEDYDTTVADMVMKWAALNCLLYTKIERDGTKG